MSKRGVSFDEKKARMLQLFYEKKEFFQLKELEKIAPREKGITANTVKDVIQALVDEEAIDTDKIGGSVYFWSFPNKLINTKKRKLEEIENKLESSSKRLKLVTNDVAKAKVGKENISETPELMKEIENLRSHKEKLLLQLKTQSENDPRKVEQMKVDLETVKAAANRWTDNIFAIKAWCKKKFMIEDSVLNKQFKIPEDLDYLP